MGQGTDSCGGYEVDYDEYDDPGLQGHWIQRNGTPIKIADMTVSHMRNTIRVCRNLAACATFSSDADKWNEWIEVFEDEIAVRERSAPAAAPKITTPPKPVRGTKIIMICHCGQEYDARKADLDRGWALSCSKRCASIRREFGRPAAKRKV